MSDALRIYRSYLGIVLSALLVPVYVFYLLLFSPASDEYLTRTITVERGAGFGSVARTLSKEGIVKNETLFKVAGVFFGATKRVKAGEYEFSTAQTPVEILQKLVRGDIKRHSVTFPEGSSIKDMARILEGSGLMNAAAFEEAARDSSLAAELGADGPTLEGYLFPDTYQIDKNTTPRDLIKLMHAGFLRAYDQGVRERAAALDMSAREVLTLASIIEKETGRVEEMRLISSVFHNRLRRGMALQSDPTVIYGIKDFDGNLTRAHLKTMTPYNTYMVAGLPPGPIASPGLSALKAAVDPETTNHLYFVSRNDGTHVFSATLTAHNAAVHTYQKKR